MINRLFSTLDKHHVFLNAKINSDSIKYKSNIVFCIIIQLKELLCAISFIPYKIPNSIIYSVTSFNILKNNKLFKKLVFTEEKYVNCKIIRKTIYTVSCEILILPIITCRLFFNNNIPKELVAPIIKAFFVFRSLKRGGVKSIVFFGFSYDLEMVVLSLLAKEHGIKTTYIVDTGFLTWSKGVSANNIIVRTKIQERFLKNSDSDEFIFDNVKVLYNIKPFSNIRKKTIGIYTTGFYSRVDNNFLKKTYINRGIIAEENMINMVVEYARDNLDIEFCIFIHKHGGIENFKDAKEQYKKALNLPNIRLQSQCEGSISSFINFDLAITSVSEIFFDRLEAGFKCGLIDCFEEEFCDTSNLELPIIKSHQDINKLLIMDEFSFFEALKGPQ